ncbi:hypothetical protein K0O13_08315 [Mammaliicoccus sciuri]|uniref:hypothetical protein n=1 Tax=Mammaliicoccus sciuri TaxID=1296 RepID=UPI001C63806F|nr:hypothetical protein [Mammaliicoccus sciuri]QYG30104.1 hypothetical protein K0O13_08315 [Mammaliicoccus sciuri]
MRVFSEVSQSLLSDEEIKVLNKTDKKLNKEVDAINSIIEKINDKQGILINEILSNLHDLREISADEIRLRSRKRVLLKEHQEHYCDFNYRGKGISNFNYISHEAESLKTMLEKVVEEFNN